MMKYMVLEQPYYGCHPSGVAIYDGNPLPITDRTYLFMIWNKKIKLLDVPKEYRILRYTLAYWSEGLTPSQYAELCANDVISI